MLGVRAFARPGSAARIRDEAEGLTMPRTSRLAAAAAACAIVALIVPWVARRGSPAAQTVSIAHAQAPPRPAAAPLRIDTVQPPAVTATAAIVIDGFTGSVLAEKSAYQPMAPASLTKIMTALVTLRRADPARKVTAQFSRDELDPDGTMMGLDPGEELTIEDLLYGLMLPSGNDAALVLSRIVGGDEANFVKLMNATALLYGLRGTQFANPHGLDAPDQRTTAYDIAQLSRYAMLDDRFRTIVGTDSWTVHSQWTYTVRNRNPLLRAYPGADGVKIGWTEQAGATIVASATRKNHRVIVALLDTEDRVGDSAALLDWAFAHHRWPGDPIAQAALSTERAALPPGPAPAAAGAGSTIQPRLREAPALP
jgi:D-alanyl-D-alanine carboxypeptidase (penicillin-binding protein 5/6)